MTGQTSSPAVLTPAAPSGTDQPASARLLAAASLVADWPQAYAGPLAELLFAESAHATRLEAVDGGWGRYPDGACLLRLADGVIAEAGR